MFTMQVNSNRGPLTISTGLAYDDYCIISDLHNTDPKFDLIRENLWCSE
jgi:hypothetical protein